MQTYFEFDQSVSANTTSGFAFGRALDIDGNAKWAIVAENAIDPGDGGAYFYQIPENDTWILNERVGSVGDNATYNAIVISNDGVWAMIPYSYTTSPENNQVSVFKRNGDTWSNTQTLIPDTEGENDISFGTSIAMSVDGTFVAVGSQFGSQIGGRIRGNVYIFKETGGVWSQTQKIVGPEDDVFLTNYGGGSMAITDSMLVVGANNGGEHGVVYVYTASGPGEFDTTPSQTLTKRENPGAYQFGFSFSLDPSSSTLAIGAVSEDAQAICIFDRGDRGEDGTWLETQTLDFELSGVFGVSIDIQNYCGSDTYGQTLIVGFGRNGFSQYRFPVELYTKVGDDSLWMYHQTLENPPDSDIFGRSVALSQDGSTAIVGSTGTVYSYTREIECESPSPSPSSQSVALCGFQPKPASTFTPLGFSFSACTTPISMTSRPGCNQPSVCIQENRKRLQGRYKHI